MRAVLAILAFVSSVLSTAPALADDNDAGGLYVGIGLGDFSTGIDDISEVDEANLDFDSDKSAERIFAGWRFNRVVALQLDRVDFKHSRDARNALNVFSTHAEGFAPSVVGTLPLGPVEVFARAGILWYDLDIDRNNTALAHNSSRDPVFGAGIGVNLGEHLNLRAEYEVVEIDGLEDPNAVWVTAAWRF